jgi:2,5-diketo-D-gluconate reductase A
MRIAPTKVPSLRLSDGIEIPRLAFGASRVPPEETQGAVELALAAGYRHIDTAAASGNEEQVGAALAASGLSREEYFITAKPWSSKQDHDSTLTAFEASLERLGLDHVDLYLLHRHVPREGPYGEAWRAFERIHGEEATRTIGVSSFCIGDLELLERETNTLPTINQVELHPYAQQAALRAWHAWHGVATEAWSPLDPDKLLDDVIVGRLAESRGKTPAQVILRWHLQQGRIVFPKSVTPSRIEENSTKRGESVPAPSSPARHSRHPKLRLQHWVADFYCSGNLFELFARGRVS